MKTTTKTNLSAPVLALLAITLAGCGGDEAATTAGPPRPEDTAAAQALLLPDAPSAPVPVGKARREAAPEQTVAVVGQIGGTIDPISGRHASFVIADEDILFCDEMPEDRCETPWDACCEDPDKLAANRATVLFLDETGAPLGLNLKEVIGLSELERVIVEGVASPDSTPENLVIHATGMHRDDK
ncbi:MAG: hypothetical protein ACLFVC_04070 [Opitutales bacterium]